MLQRQITALRHALAAPTPLASEELFVIRDLAGHALRPMEPLPGVTPREAAALLLLYPSAGELWLPLTVRSARLTTHRGEVSLPGGGADPGDGSSVQTALREAWEEWEASGRVFWEQMDATVDMLDGLALQADGRDEG